MRGRCHACDHDHDAHDYSHDRYNKIVEAKGSDFSGHNSFIVLSAIAEMSESAYQELLALMGSQDKFRAYALLGVDLLAEEIDLD